MVFQASNSSATGRCSRKHSSAVVNERHGENDVFRDSVRRCVLEGGVREVIGIQRIPIYTVVQVGHGKNLLIWRNRRTTSE